MTDAQHKTLERPLVPSGKAAGNPGDEQLAMVNQYTMREHTAEEVYVRSFYLGHTGIDRDGEIFDKGLLEDFARTLPGKGLHIKHPRSFDGDTGPGEGIWFGARLLGPMPLDEARSKLREPALKFAPGETEAYILEGDAYIVRGDYSKELITKIDAGIAKYVSLGFLSADQSPVRDDTDNIIAWRLHGPGEALESSLVWLGAQPGAAAHKAAKSQRQSEDDDMSDKELQAKIDKQAKELEDARPKAAFYDQLEALLGKDALEGEGAIEALGKAVKDGKDAHAKMVDNIVGLERRLGMVEGDSDKDVAAAKEVYADFPMLKLQALHDKYQKMAGHGGGTSGAGADGGQLGGGDPNAAGGKGEQGADGKKKGLRDASVTKGALGEQQKAA